MQQQKKQTLFKKKRVLFLTKNTFQKQTNFELELNISF
jgi:hypothetical protein